MNRVTRVAMAALLLLCGGVSAMAKSPIRLVYAAPIQGAVAGMSFSYSDIYVHVNNAAGGAWGAAIRYDDGSGTWRDAPMSLVNYYGDHILFYVRLPTSRARFAIRATWRYAVSGMTFGQDYWDNNGGADYYIAAHSAAADGIVGGNVGLVVASNYTKRASAFYWPGQPILYKQYVAGSIVVQNTSPSRRAGIRMTTDDWATYTDVPITTSMSLGYGYGSSRILLCRFAQRIGDGLPKPRLTAKFAVYYRDEATGREYWDNNFQHNYSMRPGQTIR